MELDEFVELVTERNEQAGGEKVHADFLKASILDAQLEGRTSSRADLQSCLAEARGREESAAKDLGRSQKAIPPTDPEIDSIADKLFDQLEEPAAALREQLFGSREIPFTRWEDAVKWIRDNERRYNISHDDDPKVVRLLERGREICKELSRLVDAPVSLPAIQDQTLEYLPPSGEDFVQHARVLASNLRLRPLSTFAIKASEVTGHSAAVIAYFALTGERIHPGTSITINYFRPTGRMPYTEVRIPKALPSWEDVSSAFGYLKSIRASKKGMGQATRCLIQTIRSFGGIPRKNIMRFWERVAARVKKECDLEVFTAKAARSRYERLSVEMRAALQGPEEQQSPNEPSQGTLRSSASAGPIELILSKENTRYGTINRGEFKIPLTFDQSMH